MKMLKHSVELSKRLDTTLTPAWSSNVERWYQLDELGYAFCESLHFWNYLKEFAQPDVVILAIEGASNLADFDFVSNGSLSPAKFVYTLPNISAALLFQMLHFQGKVFCVSEGTKTLKVAEEEAKLFNQMGQSVWLFGSRSETEKTREILFQSWDKN